MAATSGTQSETIGLKRTLRFRDLVLHGIILIQPTAPMPVFGVLYQESRGHVVAVILLAMIAILFTSVSYGRMARIYPRGGSAFLYVAKEIHPSLGYITGWCLVLDYVMLRGWRHGRWSQTMPMLVSLAGMATCAVLWWNLGPKAKTVGTCWAVAGVLLWIARRRFTVLPGEAA